MKYGSFYVQCTSEGDDERTEKYFELESSLYSIFSFLNRHHIHDMCVYNGDTLSLLVNNGASYMVAQLPMAAISTVTSNLVGCDILKDAIQTYAHRMSSRYLFLYC